MSYDTDPQHALRASVTVTPTGGVAVATTGVTVEPAHHALTITKGQTWALYLTWTHNDTARSTAAGTATLVARTETGGTAVLSIDATEGAAYTTFALSAAETAALAFVRASYLVAYSEGGTVTPLLCGPVDLRNPGME